MAAPSTAVANSFRPGAWLWFTSIRIIPSGQAVGLFSSLHHGRRPANSQCPERALPKVSVEFSLEAGIANPGLPGWEVSAKVALDPALMPTARHRRTT